MPIPWHSNGVLVLYQVSKGLLPSRETIRFHPRHWQRSNWYHLMLIDASINSSRSGLYHLRPVLGLRPANACREALDSLHQLLQQGRNRHAR